MHRNSQTHLQQNQPSSLIILKTKLSQRVETQDEGETFTGLVPYRGIWDWIIQVDRVPSSSSLLPFLLKSPLSFEALFCLRNQDLLLRLEELVSRIRRTLVFLNTCSRRISKKAKRFIHVIQP